MFNRKPKSWACFVYLDDESRSGTVQAKNIVEARVAFIKLIADEMNIEQDWNFERPYEDIFIVQAANGAAIVRS